MKCARCRITLVGASYLVERHAPMRPHLTANFCGDCVSDMLGPGTRNRLDRELVASGWVQLPLPLGAHGAEDRS